LSDVSFILTRNSIFLRERFFRGTHLTARNETYVSLIIISVYVYWHAWICNFKCKST